MQKNNSYDWFLKLLVIFRSKQQRVTHLLNLGIAEPTVTKLLAILEREGSIEHLNGVLKQMTKRKNQAASDIKQGKGLSINDVKVLVGGSWVFLWLLYWYLIT